MLCVCRFHAAATLPIRLGRPVRSVDAAVWHAPVLGARQLAHRLAGSYQWHVQWLCRRPLARFPELFHRRHHPPDTVRVVADDAFSPAARSMAGGGDDEQHDRMARGVVPVLDRFADDRGQDADPSCAVCASVVVVATVLALGCSTRARVMQMSFDTNQAAVVPANAGTQ